MLSVWWDWNWIVYFELLPENTKINSEVYCNQLDKSSDALKEKWPELVNRQGVVFRQNNARSHTSLVTRQKLLQLEWDVLPHPPYSLDLAPSDYYLFRSLQTRQKPLEPIFCQQASKIVWAWNQSLARNMAKDIRSKWRIHNFIKCFIINYLVNDPIST